MAQETLQERTEAPTPKRRQEARSKGQVARSPEVASALLLLAGAGAIHFGSGGLASSMAALFGQSLRVAAAPPAGVEGMTLWLQHVGQRVLAALAPVVLGIVSLALLAGVAQARGTLSWHPVRPRGERLSPLKNVKRIFGIRALVEFAKSLLKLAVVAGAVYLALSRSWPEIVALAQQPPVALLELIRRYAGRLLLAAGAAFLVLAVADYLYQIWEHERNLRMTREEVKRETKETEGDPLLKARLRSIGRALARNRMIQDVRTADAVVVNPTHLAAALRYDATVHAAPIVVALGKRKVAERIKAAALEAGVPIVEDRPLARALVSTCRVGKPIPVELYMAVAEVLAFVIRRRSKAPRRAGAVR